MEFRLDYIVNDEQKIFSLKKDTITIGKLSGNDFHLDDNSVSRNHCKLKRDGNTYKIIDLKSTNGTYVNGKRIKERSLAIGDNITIGRSIIKFLEEKRGDKITDIDDQKVSVMIPLLDNIPIKKNNIPINSELSLMESLTSLGKQLISSTTLEESFEKVGELLYSFLDPNRLYIFSYDKDDEELELKYSISEEKKTDKVKISKTIAMRSINEKVAILSSNTLDDSRFDGAKSIILYGIKSAVSIPIWTINSIYGLIYADTTHIGKKFEEHDLEILSIIANFTGLSIEGIKSRNNLIKEKKIRSRLERYHSPAIVSKIMEMQENKTGEISGYHESNASVLFMDIVGFTSRVEHMNPIEIGVFLNNLFTEMTDVIFNNNGTLDKYIGDSIMAVFGVPFEQKNHSEHAINAALEMMKKLEKINNSNQDQEKIEIRIGINSGKLIAGDFGSPKRYDYTVIGNTVNIASRLESSVAKPGDIIVSESIVKQNKKKFDFEFLGRMNLQGISKPVKSYVVIGKKRRYDD